MGRRKGGSTGAGWGGAQLGLLVGTETPGAGNNVQSNQGDYEGLKRHKRLIHLSSEEISC